MDGNMNNFGSIPDDIAKQVAELEKQNQTDEPEVWKPKPPEIEMPVLVKIRASQDVINNAIEEMQKQNEPEHRPVTEDMDEDEGEAGDFVVNNDVPSWHEDTCNLEITQSPFSKASEEQMAKAKSNNVYLAVPAEMADTIRDYINRQEEENPSSFNNDEARNKLDVYLQSTRHVPTYRGQSALTKTIKDTNSEWVQEIDTAQAKLRPAIPKYSDAPAERLKGRDAAIRVLSLMNIKPSFIVPLWHSGFWVTLVAPSDADLLNIQIQMAQSKIELGRVTVGNIFGNESVYMVQHLMDLFKKLMVGCSLQLAPDDDILDYIKVQDIQMIAYQIACLIWPDGTIFRRVLIGKEDLETVSGVLDLKRCLWTNTRALTAWQKQHMTKRLGNSMTKADIERYQSEFPDGMMSRRVLLRKNDEREMFVTLAIPTVREHILHGDSWVHEITQDLEDLLGVDDIDNRRNQLAYWQANVRPVGQYRHYVKSFVYVDNNTGVEEVHEGVSEDGTDTVNSFITSIDAVPEFTETIMTGIGNLIDESTICLVATPTVKSENIDGELKHFKNLVPMDALHVFFTLGEQKLNQKVG